MTDQQYLNLLKSSEPALEQFEQFEQSVEDFHNSTLERIQRKLEEMGVVDVKVSRDGETWNSVAKDERAESLVRVLGAYVAGEYVPLGELKDTELV